MSKDERPYEYLFYFWIAGLPLRGGYRESFRRIWDAVNKVYDEAEAKGRREGAVQATQSCYFAERKLLLKISELEKEEHSYGASYEILDLIEKRLKELSSTAVEDSGRKRPSKGATK
jgi:hypothetical protein